MSNTQLVVLSVADERSARDLASILSEIDRRDDNVTIVDAAIAMKDFRGKPQTIQLKKAVETRSGSLLGGITSVFREKGIDEAILRKKAQIMEPGQVSLFVLYTGTWDKSRRALRHALHTFGIEFTDGQAQQAPDKSRDDMAQRPPMRSADRYGNGSYAPDGYRADYDAEYGSEYGSDYDEDDRTTFEGETFGSSIDWPSSDKITVFTELEGDDPYFGEDSASYDDEPIFGEESAVADITDQFGSDYRSDRPFYRQTEEDSAEDVEDEEFVDEPVTESPTDEAETDSGVSLAVEEDVSLYRGLGDVTPTADEEWIIEEVTKLDVMAEATRAALIAGATKQAREEPAEEDTEPVAEDELEDVEDSAESVEEPLEDEIEEEVEAIADVVDEAETIDRQQGEALRAASADIAHHSQQIRSYGSLQHETGLELVEIAAELEEFSQEVREQELALLSAVLSNRGEQLYALAKEIIASASSASKLAKTLNGASQAVEALGVEESAD